MLESSKRNCSLAPFDRHLSVQKGTAEEKPRLEGDLFDWFTPDKGPPASTRTSFEPVAMNIHCRETKWKVVYKMI